VKVGRETSMRKKKQEEGKKRKLDVGWGKEGMYRGRRGFGKKVNYTS